MFHVLRKISIIFTLLQSWMVNTRFFHRFLNCSHCSIGLGVHSIERVNHISNTVWIVHQCEGDIQSHLFKWGFSRIIQPND